MKILQIIQKPQLRGAEIFACQLSLELIKYGAAADVAYLFKNTSFDLDFDLNFIDAGANQVLRLMDVRAYKRLDDIIRNGAYDVVQANAGDTLEYAAISKLLFKWKPLLIYRNANKMSWFLKNRLSLAFNRLLLNQCDYFISVSENCRKDLINIYSAAGTRSNAIPIGTYDHSGIQPIQRGTAESIIISVSSFVPEKNHEFIIDIFKAYYEKYKEGYLWLVGDGPFKERLKYKVSAYGLDKRVVFWGVQKSVISLIKAADVMLMPSKVEGLPGVILEALSCGVTVIASDVGGIKEVIDSGKNGYVIGSFDIPEYVDTLASVLKDIVLKDRLGKAGIDTVKKFYLMPAIARRFLETYEKTL